MHIETLEEIPVFVLPDNGICLQDEEERNPLFLEECPLGRVCHPDCCEYYAEE